MPRFASLLLGSTFALALSFTSTTSFAQARSGDAFVPTVAPPSDSTDAAAPATKMKSGAMVGVGIASTVVGAAEGVLGTVLVAGDARDDNGMFDGFGTFFGTIALIDAAIHLGVGIPLIVVGAQREPTEPAGDEAGIDTAEVSVRGSEVVASFTF